MSREKMGISPEEIERAREYDWNDLLVFTRGYALCPFHEEKTGSFHINKHTNRAKCFGCSWEGDTIDYWMKKNGTGFTEAVRALL